MKGSDTIQMYGAMRGWINDDRIYILGELSLNYSHTLMKKRYSERHWHQHHLFLLPRSSQLSHHIPSQRSSQFLTSSLCSFSAVSQSLISVIHFHSWTWQEFVSWNQNQAKSNTDHKRPGDALQAGHESPNLHTPQYFMCIYPVFKPEPVYLSTRGSASNVPRYHISPSNLNKKCTVLYVFYCIAFASQNLISN